MAGFLRWVLREEIFSHNYLCESGDVQNPSSRQKKKKRETPLLGVVVAVAAAVDVVAVVMVAISQSFLEKRAMMAIETNVRKILPKP